MRQLELLRPKELLRTPSDELALDEETLVELVAVMAEAMLAALEKETEADDER